MVYNAPKDRGLEVFGQTLSIMFWGGLFRNFYDDPQLKINVFDKKVPIKFLVLLLTLAILFVPMLSLVKGILSDEFNYIQHGLSHSIGIILFLILSNTIKIENRFIAWIGTISYSMYLFHPIVFYTLFWWLRNYAPTPLTELNLIVYLIVNFALSIAFSAITYYLVEKPFINISYHLTSYKKTLIPAEIMNKTKTNILTGFP